MALLDCTIASPEELLFEGKAASVVVPATDGELGILPRHAALVGALGYGELRLQTESGERLRYFIEDGGFVEVLNNRVTVLAGKAATLSAVDRDAVRKELEELQDRPPNAGAPAEERHAYDEQVNVLKRKLRVSA